uniref:Hsp90 co-chaperone AHA1 n=1 Tax=Solanum tuberosum TaxID=4113 RepID=M1DA92_SOLTU
MAPMFTIGTSLKLTALNSVETDYNLLVNKTLIDDEENLKIRMKNLEGEASMNIQNYFGVRMNLVFSWEGEVKEVDVNSTVKIEGNVEFPYITDENADEDP